MESSVHLNFAGFQGLCTLDLASHRFSGPFPDSFGHCSKMKILSSAKNGDERAATLQEPLNGSAPRSRPTTTIAPLEMLSLVRNVTVLVLFLGSAATLSPHAQGSSAQCFQDKYTSKRMLAMSLPRQHREARACITHTALVLPWKYETWLYLHLYTSSADSSSKKKK